MKNICLITGAAGLLGKMHAEAILEMGKDLCITDVNLKKLKGLYSNLKKRYPKKEILYKKLDVTNEKQIKKIYTTLNRRYFVSILINNAAIDFKIKKKTKTKCYK